MAKNRTSKLQHKILGILEYCSILGFVKQKELLWELDCNKQTLSKSLKNLEKKGLIDIYKHKPCFKSKKSSQ